MNPKAQIAMEYMIIVLIVLLFITPAWLYLQQVKGETSDQMGLSYAKNSVTRLAESADMVYSQRLGAKMKISVFVPANVQEVNMTGDTVNMRVLTSNGLVDVWSSSMAQLNGTIPATEGLYWVVVEAMGSYVQIGLV
jgi:uncharacterized protein (UPF0333 family)